MGMGKGRGCFKKHLKIYLSLKLIYSNKMKLIKNFNGFILNIFDKRIYMYDLWLL